MWGCYTWSDNLQYRCQEQPNPYLLKERRKILRLVSLIMSLSCSQLMWNFHRTDMEMSISMNKQLFDSLPNRAYMELLTMIIFCHWNGQHDKFVLLWSRGNCNKIIFMHTLNRPYLLHDLWQKKLALPVWKRKLLLTFSYLIYTTIPTFVIF